MLCLNISMIHANDDLNLCPKLGTLTAIEALGTAGVAAYTYYKIPSSNPNRKQYLYLAGASLAATIISATLTGAVCQQTK